MSTLKKAIIEIYKDNGKNVEEVECAFNPSQYTIKSSANYKEDHSIGTDVSRMIFYPAPRKNLQPHCSLIVRAKSVVQAT